MSWFSRLFYGRIGNISSSELLSSKNEAAENLESNPPSTGDIKSEPVSDGVRRCACCGCTDGLYPNEDICSACDVSYHS